MRPATARLRLVAIAGALVTTTVLAAAQTPSPVLLVLLLSGKVVAVVDPGSSKVVGRIPTADSPECLTVSSDGTIAFTAYPDGTLSVFDVAARKEIRRVDLGRETRPNRVLYAGGKVYFTAPGYKAIGVYDPVSNRILGFVGHGQNSTNIIAMTRDGDKLFVSHRDSNTVSAIEGMRAGAPKWTVTTIPVSGSAEGLDISPDGRQVWTAHRFGGGVSIIDVATKKVVGEVKVPFGKPAGEGSQATRLSFTPDGRRALLLNRPTAEVVVLDAAARKEIKRIQVPGDGILVTPDGSRAYVSVEIPPKGTDSHVAVIDMKTLAVTGKIPTGGRPTYMAWAPFK